MKKTKLHLAWLWGLLLLITTSSCGNDDDYYYPSVKLEYVTVQADEDGRIHTLIPDKGEPLPVSEDRTASTISPNESKRVISNYETLSEGEQSTAVIYSIQALPTPKPQPADAPDFRDGIKTDPVDLVSIWMGKNYLNLILNVKADDKQHVFGIVEDLSELETNHTVTLLLYHNANGDKENYNRRAYLSVPLDKYVNIESPNQIINFKFKYYTRNKDGLVIAEEKSF